MVKPVVVILVVPIAACTTGVTVMVLLSVGVPVISAVPFALYVYVKLACIEGSAGKVYPVAGVMTIGVIAPLTVCGEFVSV